MVPPPDTICSLQYTNDLPFAQCLIVHCQVLFFHFISTLGAHHFTLVPTVGTVPSVDMI